MHLPLRRTAAIVAVALASSLMAALPASADDDPATVTVDDGVVEYVDPSLADADTERVKGVLRLAVVDRIDPATGRMVDGHEYAIETTDGERTTLDLAEDLPDSAANGTIVAELVDADSPEPQVAEATVVEPAATAAAAGQARRHELYIAVLTNTGTVPSNVDVESTIDRVASDWVADTEGLVTDVVVARTVRYAPAQVTKAEACSFDHSGRVWSEASTKLGFTSWPPDSSVVNHLVVFVAGTGACASSAKGTLGIAHVGNGLGSQGLKSIIAWGSDPAMRDATVIHELGHNFGLGHANLSAPSGAVSGYLDMYSVMGFGLAGNQAPALDSAFRDRLGVAAVPSDTAVVEPVYGTDEIVVLAPRGSASGTRAVQVVDPAGPVYWIEYRDAVARDTGAKYGGGLQLSNSAYTFREGVTITRIASDGELSLLARTTTEPEYSAGETFTPPSGNFTLRVVDVVNSSSATVRVVADPVVTGTPRVGATLSVRPTAPGQTVQWFRDGVAVPAATQTSYPLGPADHNRRIHVDVTYEGETRSSPATSPIAAGIIKTSRVTIVGSARKGRTLWIRAASSPARATVSYQWFVNGRAIKGATGRAYKIPKKYVKKRLRAQVVFRSPGYSAVGVWSPSTAKVKK